MPRLKVTVGLVMCEFCIFRAMALRMPVMGTASSRGASSAGALPPFCTAASMSAAITRPLAGTSLRSRPMSAATFAARGLALTPGSAGAAGGGGGGADLKFFTSSSVTRPLGPVPGTSAMSMPSSLASFLAAGVASTLSPGALAGAGGGGGGAAGLSPSGAGFSSAPPRSEA